MKVVQMTAFQLPFLLDNVACALLLYKSKLPYWWLLPFGDVYIQGIVAAFQIGLLDKCFQSVGEVAKV